MVSLTILFVVFEKDEWPDVVVEVEFRLLLELRLVSDQCLLDDGCSSLEEKNV